MNTENMTKAYDKNGNELAYTKVRKNEYGEYVARAYFNGKFDEDKTIYGDSREDAIETMNTELKFFAGDDEPVAEVVEKSIELTEKETMVLTAIIKNSNFNFDKIDLEKPWEEQRLEGGTFYAFADTKDYGCGLGTQACRAIFGSLQKKGMLDIVDDDDIDWIHIHEGHFDNIKKAL